MLNINEIKNPKKSIFVCANAGSGKTFILVARVLGLLLAGEEPTKILCISFTEAASSEVEERIISKLKAWHKGETAGDILLEGATEEQKQRAKSLYHEVILLKKMPKIMTFHAFCMQIVSLFSAESEVCYKPSILKENVKKDLQAKVFKSLIQNPQTKEFIDKMKELFSIHSLKNEIIPEVLNSKHKYIFAKQRDVGIIYDYLGLEPFQNSILWWKEDLLANFPLNELESLIFKAKKTKLSESMNIKIETMESFKVDKNIASLKKIFFTNSSEPTKLTPFPKVHLDEIWEWQFIQDYLIEKLEQEKKINTLIATQSLMKLASFIFEFYEEEKRKLEALDFDDFISIANKSLMGDERDFILFKLDGGINHILVDEAQDTNHNQWSVLNSILEEFFAGSEEAKSLFVVGDDKQSIFGFQGSEPEALNKVFEKYSNNFVNLHLDTSFRTTKPILDFVDSIFSKEPYKNLISKQDYKFHKSNIIDGFGRIEICELPELLQSPKKEQKNGLFKMPFEEESEDTVKLILARQISQKILDILKEGRKILGKNRRVKPCDFMLIIQFRDGELFDNLKKELKIHNIDIAFCDKIKLKDSLIISDFISLLRYLLNEKNTLALGIALRSPMFEFTDSMLTEVFKNQNLSLIEDVLALKPLLLKSVEGFFIEVFTKFQHKYTKAEIREFAYLFNIINDYKSMTFAPNFEGFINFFDEMCKNDAEFKINLEEEENAIKISTVHGCKGLESPIVFILNATEIFSKNDSKSKFMYDNQNELFLCTKSVYKCEEWLSLQEEEKERTLAEYMRLFYVALTRAKEEIYIFPKRELKEKEAHKSWYEIAKDELPSLKLCKNEMQFGDDEVKPKAVIKNTLVEVGKMEFIKTFTKSATQNVAQSPELQIGSIIHEMLDSTSKTLEMKYFQNKFNLVSSEIILTLWNKALLIKQKFSFLFEREVLSEVEIMQEISNKSIFKGKIDKLIINEEVLIYDFKYKKTKEQRIVYQLQMYKEALSRIYPNKTIRCFILWLKEGEIEEFLHSSLI